MAVLLYKLQTKAIARKCHFVYKLCPLIRGSVCNKIFKELLTHIHTCTHLHLHTHTHTLTYTHTCTHTHTDLGLKVRELLHQPLPYYRPPLASQAGHLGHLRGLVSVCVGQMLGNLEPREEVIRSTPGHPPPPPPPPLSLSLSLSHTHTHTHTLNKRPWSYGRQI